MNLNSKQRKVLEKAANSIDPVVIVGGNGVSEGVKQKVLKSLESHELLKVRFNEFKDEKYELTSEIVEFCDAALVRIIGNVAIIYKMSEKPENRVFEKELAKFA